LSSQTRYLGSNGHWQKDKGGPTSWRNTVDACRCCDEGLSLLLFLFFVLCYSYGKGLLTTTLSKVSVNGKKKMPVEEAEGEEGMILVPKMKSYPCMWLSSVVFMCANGTVCETDVPIHKTNKHPWSSCVCNLYTSLLLLVLLMLLSV